MQDNKRKKGLEYKRNYLGDDFVDDIAKRNWEELLGIRYFLLFGD
jgi:hypothetical protein